MIRGFYSSKSGLLGQQSKLNIIANNIANTSTTGYKPQQSKFTALMYENVNGGGGNTIQAGNGTKAENGGVNFTQGELQNTGILMDCAIVGEGFFAVKNKVDGENYYTRDGQFQLSAEGSDTFIVNSRGDYVLGEGQEKIDVKEGFDISKIGIFKFDNKYGLTPAGGGQYKVTEASGEATSMEGAVVKSGYLESSAVRVSEEMVKMIEASKGFSFNAKLIQVADEMEKTINQLR